MATVPERFRLRTEPVNEKRFVALFAAAAFAHVVLDAVTTMLAVYYGGGYELNPLLRPHLDRGPMAFVVAYSPLAVITVCCGIGMVYFLRKADLPWNRYICQFGQLGFAVALGWGLYVSLTNLLVFL